MVEIWYSSIFFIKLSTIEWKLLRTYIVALEFALQVVFMLAILKYFLFIFFTPSIFYNPLFECVMRAKWELEVKAGKKVCCFTSGQSNMEETEEMGRRRRRLTRNGQFFYQSGQTITLIKLRKGLYLNTWSKSANKLLDR